MVNRIPPPRRSIINAAQRSGDNENVIVDAVLPRRLIVNAVQRLNNEDVIVDFKEIQSEDTIGLIPILLLNKEMYCCRILSYVTNKLPPKPVLTPKGKVGVLNFFAVDEENMKIAFKCFMDTRPEVFREISKGVFYLFEGPGTAVVKVNPKFSRTNHPYEIIVNDDVRIRRYEGPQPFIPPLTNKLGVVGGIEVNVFSIGDAMNMGLNDGYYFNITGRVGQALEGMFYKSCLGNTCFGTRVRQIDEDTYFCPNCRKNSHSFGHSYFLRL